MELYDQPKKVGPYLRYARVCLAEIPMVVEGRITFPNGMSVNAKSSRMQLLWLRKELICRFCGISAGFGAIEAHPDTPDALHLNFYCYDFEGREVMLTRDHIEPKSLGGNNQQKNQQCLCSVCNGLKGNDKSQSEVTKLRRQKGLPLYYTYFADGSVKYKWAAHQFSSTLKGEAQSTKSGCIN